MRLNRRSLVVPFLVAAAACHAEFEVAHFPTNASLYKAAQTEFAAQRWDNAIMAFEKLTTDLPARDTLLPRATWFLARAHEERGEFVLAATSYTRIVESFPDDSLADRAALQAARCYRRMWRKPALDATYGQTAEATYTTLIGLYPQSPLIPVARKELDSLEDMFAQKNYLSAMYYFRRGGYDSGIIYFKDVLTKYPTTPTAKLAQLRLVDSYRAIRYKDDAIETCAALRKNYPDDADVKLSCQGVASPVAIVPVAPPNAPPTATGPPATAPVPPTPTR